MRSTIPMIEKHFDKNLKMNYFDPVDFDEEDIEDTIKSRERFKKVRELTKKIWNINDKDFFEGFVNHYLICAEKLNDARIAMFAIYNTIRMKSKGDYTVGDYIIEEKSDNFVMNANGGLSDEDFDDEFEDEVDYEMKSARNPIVKEIPVWSGGNFNSENYTDRIVFSLHVKGDGVSCMENALENGEIYVEVLEDEADSIDELLQNMLSDAGYDFSGIDKELHEMVNMLDTPNEYKINRLFRVMTSTHLLNHPDDKTLRLDDIEPFMNIEKKTSESDEKLKGNLVGLKEERKKLKGIIDMLRLEMRRRKFGYQRISNGCNIAFAGPPGTAKTTLARQFAAALEEMKLISSASNFKECRKSDIVGAYVGWTAKKVDEIFRSMAWNGGGVIFFDEIYTLSDSKTDFDKEAITCITQNMENYRDKVFCIFAGYGDKMDEFLSTNPGLRSRIQFNIKFNDYDNNTLYEIFCSIVKNNGFDIDGECFSEVVSFFTQLKNMRGSQFGNGREARNLFTNAVQKMSYRLGDKETMTRTELTTLTANDICLAAEDILSSEIKEKNKTTGRIGFAA